MTVIIDICNDCESASVPADKLLQNWANVTINHLNEFPDSACRLTAGNERNAAKPLTLSLRIVDLLESSRLNLTFRQKDSATNVLSFASDLPVAVADALDEYPLGDLAICAPVVEREALEQKKQPEAHWAHMLVHGVLHLYGFDHENDADAEKMETREKIILAQIGFPDPY